MDPGLVAGERPRPDRDAGEGGAQHRSGDHVGSVVDLDVDPAGGDHGGHGVVEGLQRWVMVAEHPCRGERRAGMPAGKAGSEWLAEVVGAGFGGLWSRTFDQPLDSLVDHHRLHQQHRGQPDGGIGVAIGAKTLGRADEVPDQAEISQLRGQVEHLVDLGVAAQDLTPDMIHGFVEAVYRPPQAGARICAPVCARVCSGHEAMLTAEVTREMSPPWLGQ